MNKKNLIALVVVATLGVITYLTSKNNDDQPSSKTGIGAEVVKKIDTTKMDARDEKREKQIDSCLSSF